MQQRCSKWIKKNNNKKKNNKKNRNKKIIIKKIINVDKELTENLKIKKIKKNFEKESKFEYNNVWKHQRKEFECTNTYNISY